MTDLSLASQIRDLAIRRTIEYYAQVNTAMGGQGPWIPTTKQMFKHITDFETYISMGAIPQEEA